MGKRVLVINDNELTRKLFSQALEDTEYQVETVESGEKGIEKAQDAKYDLIFLDLKMLGLDGVQTLRELRRIDGDVPVYIVTAFHSEFFNKLKRATADGTDFEVFKKPTSSDQIVFLAKSVLEGPEGF